MVPRKSWVSENFSQMLESRQRFYQVSEALFFSFFGSEIARVEFQTRVLASLECYYSPPLILNPHMNTVCTQPSLQCAAYISKIISVYKKTTLKKRLITNSQIPLLTCIWIFLGSHIWIILINQQAFNYPWCSLQGFTSITYQLKWIPPFHKTGVQLHLSRSKPASHSSCFRPGLKHSYNLELHTRALPIQQQQKFNHAFILIIHIIFINPFIPMLKTFSQFFSKTSIFVCEMS